MEQTVHVAPMPPAPGQKGSPAHGDKLILEVCYRFGYVQVAAVVDQAHHSIYDAEVLWVNVAAYEPVAMTLDQQVDQARTITTGIRLAVLEGIYQDMLMANLFPCLQRIQRACICPATDQPRQHRLRAR